MFNKENLLNFALLALASAVGVVIVAPFVQKLWNKVPLPK